MWQGRRCGRGRRAREREQALKGPHKWGETGYFYRTPKWKAVSRAGGEKKHAATLRIKWIAAMGLDRLAVQFLWRFIFLLLIPLFYHRL